MNIPTPEPSSASLSDSSNAQTDDTHTNNNNTPKRARTHTVVTITRRCGKRYDKKIVSRTGEASLDMPRPTLIFDLDRTIVYPHVCDAATNDDIIQYAAWQTVERLRAPSTNTNVHGISKGLPRRGLDAGPLIGNSFRMFENTIYVRPGIIDCLRRLSKSFDLAVATLGGAEYASNVLGVIDPDASIFDNRVASRENFRDGVKRIPHEWGGIAGAIVFDDTPSAWESDALVFPAVAYFGPPCQVAPTKPNRGEEVRAADAELQTEYMRTVTKYFEELLVFYSKSVSASSEEKPSADGFVYFLRSENCVHNFSRGFVTVRTVAQNSEASRGKARKRKPRPRKGTRTRPRKCPRTGCDDDAAGDDDVHARQQPPHDYRSSALCDSYFSARSDEEEEENVDNPRVEKDAAILTGQVPEYGIRYPASADACGRWDWAPLSQTSAPCFYLFPEETVDSPPCRFSEDRYQFI